MAPGDYVRWLDSDMEGLVVALLEQGKVVVHTTEGMDLPVAVSELVVVSATAPQPEAPLSDRLRHQLLGGSQAPEVPHAYRKDRELPKPKRARIDLHADKLAGCPADPGRILAYQLDCLSQAMSRALHQGASQLLVIHGVGQGTLRNEVVRLVNSGTWPVKRYERLGGGETLIHF